MIEGDMSYINSDIDRCNSSITHYDISIIVFKVLKDDFRYIGSKQWEYYDKISKTWINDEKADRLRFQIKTIISDLFTKRALFWYAESSKCEDVNSEIHSKFMSEKMLNISSKLKNNNFISVVIREAQSFFDIHNND